MVVEITSIQDRYNQPSLQKGKICAQQDIKLKRADYDNRKEQEVIDINKEVEHLKQNLNLIHNVKIKFSIHKATGRMRIVVSDEDTGKVIREIPPSQLLDIAAKLDEMIGIIFDQKG